MPVVRTVSATKGNSAGASAPEVEVEAGAADSEGSGGCGVGWGPGNVLIANTLVSRHLRPWQGARDSGF
ncbi:hypothetical protein CFL01nite_18260 [Corynebacterium flavescens]|uniref:Uncharacterized protein n=1 Tax=Corynebacterium flavescens TaxID=28028 RepID=A0AB73B9R3_CORFL|nr:hypothetical protein CFL01nite_18260 [Corynebacterium flavescens]